MKRKNKYTGSDFDDFLREEGIFEECSAKAIKFMLANELAEKIEKEQISKSEVARKLKTSRTALERILDSKNSSITLNTLNKIASFIGKKLEVRLIPA